MSAKARIKAILDKNGVIRKAAKVLPTESLKIKFLEALAELEDNECHRTQTFPKTRLHRIKGIKEAIYRADIDKLSGWRIHVQYVDGVLYLNDVIEGKWHDEPIQVVRSKKWRYKK